MNYLAFTVPDRQRYPVCILSMGPLIRHDLIDAYMHANGIPQADVAALVLHQNPEKKKTPKAEMVSFITEELAPTLEHLDAQYLIINDAEYFKAMTGASKADASIGYVMDCLHGPWKAIYLPAPRQIFYDPAKVRAKIQQGLDAMISHIQHTYKAPGADIIHYADYPQTVAQIRDWLTKLKGYPFLSCDIETFSLKHPTSGIGTITFCWSEHEGIAFPVDLGPSAKKVRILLKEFFETYTGKLRYHNIAFDVYILIYQLFMQNILDTAGLLNGLDVMLANWDCTQLITYLATNSCAGNQLGLKVQSQEFSGNYSIEQITDIRAIPLDRLLEYNLIDGLSTNYVYNKHWLTLINDQQLGVYEKLFKPAIADIIQMQLTGLPLDMNRVKEVKKLLEADQQSALGRIMANPWTVRYIQRLQEKHVLKRNAVLKTKQISLADEETQRVTFNPNSPDQLVELIYDIIGMPILARSESGAGSTKGKDLKTLKFHTQDQDVMDLLDALIDWKAVAKILQDFIPSFEAATLGPDGWHYLFGNFKLGGTLSGRLSSNSPNLQNLPSSGSRYAKIIKSCFRAPPGWIFGGLDFASLEDKISALTTKDPNKLKVYTDGYDGHSLRAHAYFGEHMQDIRQVTDQQRCFRVVIGDETHFLVEGDLVQLPDQTIKPIEEIIDAQKI